MTNLSNPYSKGMNLQIPEEFMEDYMDEYKRADDLNDPLLMFILQRAAQEGFKTGPIGTDGYFEHYDPALNENERENFTNFVNTYYPTAENAHYELGEPGTKQRLSQNPKELAKYKALSRAHLYANGFYDEDKDFMHDSIDDVLDDYDTYNEDLNNGYVPEGFNPAVNPKLIKGYQDDLDDIEFEAAQDYYNEKYPIKNNYDITDPTVSFDDYTKGPKQRLDDSYKNAIYKNLIKNHPVWRKKALNMIQNEE